MIDAIDADDDLSDEVRDYVLAALEGPTSLQELLDGISTPHAPRVSGRRDCRRACRCVPDVHRWAGFRGIGQKATLELHPALGITVVTGRTGSGKSNFAEALELAVTGESCRWKNKASLWADSWRNLHHGNPCEVRVGLTVDGSEPMVVDVDWTADAELENCTTWMQAGKQGTAPGSVDSWAEWFIARVRAGWLSRTRLA